MSQLFAPITLRHLTLPNRIVIAPMCQYSAENGLVSSWHLMHYGSLAVSGAGLMILEATAIEPIGRISDKDLGLWDEATEQALAQMLLEIRKYSAIPIGIQLAHAGRKGSTPASWIGQRGLSEEEGGWQTVAPSAAALGMNYSTPKAISTLEVEQIIERFVEAAQRAERLGLEVIEIHAAHGYLLHEFLSPLTNQRQDQYGGSLENRLRLVLELFQAIKASVAVEMIVGVRISATDWMAGGWDLEQSVVLCKELECLGCDYIHVSSGGLALEQKITLGPNYQIPFAQRIKTEVAIPVIGVGLITEPEQAEAVVLTKQADMVAMGRAMLYNPRWPWHAAQKLGAQVIAPPQYLRSAPRLAHKLFK